MQTSLLEHVHTLDLTNCRYQGQLNQSQQLHGLGIAIDDNMTLYCSEWLSDKLHGDTLILQRNGSYLYGTFNKNQPAAVLSFRNDQYIIISHFPKDELLGKSIAIDNAMINSIWFRTEDLFCKNNKYKTDRIFNSYKQIQNNTNFQETITEMMAIYGIKIQKCYLSLFQFLKKIHKKYIKLLSFKCNEGLCYFGLKGGLGFTFIFQNNVTKKISLRSIGSYGIDKVIEYGVKFHNTRCIEEGNFRSKQTITYNLHRQRPQEKCNSIYRKIHASSQSFINQEGKFSKIVQIFQNFAFGKLQEEFQHAVEEFYRKRHRQMGYSKAISHNKSQKTLKKQNQLSVIKPRNTKNDQQEKSSHSKNTTQRPYRNKISPYKKSKKVESYRQAKIKQNEIKIREELYHQQIKMSHELLSPLKINTQWIDPVISVSPSKVLIHQVQDYRPRYHQNNYQKTLQQKQKIKDEYNSYQRNLQQRIDNIQNRRLKLLNEFKQLNIPSPCPDRVLTSSRNQQNIKKTLTNSITHSIIKKINL